MAFSQFDPEGGEIGSKSIPRTHSSIQAWADSIVFEPGYLNIADKSLGKVPASADLATGAADGTVVSLGDSGYATYILQEDLIDQPGFDFAVFENGFEAGNGYFLELAFVEVSKDGQSFTRFPTLTAADTNTQLSLTSTSQPEYYHNFAGKYQSPYGALFDIGELGLDTVRYIRIVDVIGSTTDSIGSRDSEGKIINDPWPSPFNNCGFDLDALAIIDGSILSMETHNIAQFKLYPNPASTNEWIKLETAAEYHVYNNAGQLIDFGFGEQIKLADTGIYILEIKLNNGLWLRRKLIIS
ncbi:T9SS type A sorting domain-containing protein [bacterium]|nr:T9SS type A sorting domain-containing protein [bacterium]